jgi:hypothetical protein
MTKVKLEIEGQLCDLADLFAALAQATAQPVISSEVKQVFQFRGVESGVGEFKEGVTYPKIDSVDTLDGQHGAYYLDCANHTGTQSENTIEPEDAGKIKRTRRTKAQLEAERLAAEQSAQDNANGPVDEENKPLQVLSQSEVAHNLGAPYDPADYPGPARTEPEWIVEAAIKEEQAKRQTAVEDVRRAEQESQTAQTEAVVTANGAAAVNVPAANPLLTGINFDGPYIETMRKAAQLMIAKNVANKDLILGLLSEFGAKGLSEVKDEDKIAFKMRFKDLPFKG